MSTARIALSIGIWLVALGVTLPAHAHDRPDAAEPGRRCEAEKLKEASRYHACLMNARFRAVIVGRNPERAMARCDARFGAKWPRIERRGGELCPSTGDEESIQSLLSGQADDLATLLSGGTVIDQAFPATGQITCTNPTGPFEIPCEGTGRDGDVRAGAPLAYRDNGDGTITDLNTGLKWEKLSDDRSIHWRFNRFTWDEAFTVKIATLNSTAFAGHTDWRVPNVKELVSIVDYEVSDPSIGSVFNNGTCGLGEGCSVLTCSCPGGIMWSSSRVPTFPELAWTVEFEFGLLEDREKSLPHSVRAVRGP